MYIPNSYKNENISEVKHFIDSNSFGILVSQIDGKSNATHIPLELSKNKFGKDILQGHVAKANPHWHHFKNNTEALAIFTGPHGYISSSWYDFEEVPTNLVNFNQHNAINIGVAFSEGVNVVKIGQLLTDKLAEIDYARPAGMEIEYMYNQPAEVDKSVKNKLKCNALL